MNRSLLNVLMGAIGPDSGPAVDADEMYAGRVKRTSAEEVAMLFDGARRVVIVPAGTGRCSISSPPSRRGSYS